MQVVSVYRAGTRFKIMEGYLTVEDDGELERRTDKWCRQLLQNVYGLPFMWECVRLNGLQANGITLGPVELAVLIKAAPYFDAAAAIKSRIPSDKVARRLFLPHKQPDWPT